MKLFEDEFMEVQSGLIALCIEVLEGKPVNKIYAYCSIEEHSLMFNAFFEQCGRLFTLNGMGISHDLAMQFLSTGTEDLEKIESLCRRYNRPVPREMKLIYETSTGKFNADYKYQEVCSAKTGKESGEVFKEWEEEVRNNLNS